MPVIADCLQGLGTVEGSHIRANHFRYLSLSGVDKTFFLGDILLQDGGNLDLCKPL